MRGPTPAIRFDAVAKTYPVRPLPLRAVERVSFAVARGEFVALLGPSGCGKSTLLAMAAGLEAPTEGMVEVGGAMLEKPHRDTALMFQDATLLPWLSVLDNVLFPATIRKLRREEVLPRAMQLIEMVGLKGFERRRPHELSGGMRQRAAICRALVLDPQLLLMDEPFSALDAITRDEMAVVLLDIWQHTAKSAIFVTHSIREAVLLADRVMVMSRRPATIAEELVIPFARPRLPDLADSQEFTDICAHLRATIAHGMAGPDTGR
ncbi:ABC transporter ATP-binding protein [Sediminicoccus sp. KRV36]|uniref:ABC transporter ATP-binding protein n=1 Tax=Sediminicoccus sp. KRV36 TaxID=3133721 RepID=UPI00200E6917|nr:ABC transporter ATP-binding protein [Sediminicoccus rosea]UPY38764.1 ABC transporter ATP-binding protein [Sediminicoccus rosea]